MHNNSFMRIDFMRPGFDQMNPNGNKYMQNFILFQNFTDSCLKNDPYFRFRGFVRPIEKIQMGTSMIGSGDGGWG